MTRRSLFQILLAALFVPKPAVFDHNGECLSCDGLGEHEPGCPHGKIRMIPADCVSCGALYFVNEYSPWVEDFYFCGPDCQKTYHNKQFYRKR